MLQELTRAEREIEAPGTLKRRLGAILKAQTQRRIKSEKQAPDGARWSPWAPSTSKKGHLLYKSGAFYKGIKASVTKQGVSITTDTPYGYLHDVGTSRMPARPWIGISRDNLREVEKAVDSWLEEVWK